VTFKERVCEDVNWINLALDKHYDGNEGLSFYESVELLVCH
jgi:hypothetical protein